MVNEPAKLKAALTAERLREQLGYDPETGRFAWVARKGSRAKEGGEAGVSTGTGYLRIKVDGREYKAHRLAWLHVHGEWPADQLDHRNGVRDDNRIANLRECSGAENDQNRGTQKNNTSGVTGVSWHKRSQRWRARLNVGGRRLHVGDFKTFDEAVAARAAAKAELHTFQPVARS